MWPGVRRAEPGADTGASSAASSAALIQYGLIRQRNAQAGTLGADWAR